MRGEKPLVKRVGCAMLAPLDNFMATKGLVNVLFPANEINDIVKSKSRQALLHAANGIGHNGLSKLQVPAQT